MGYDLQIWSEFSDLCGATIWFGPPTVFGKVYHIDLNEYSKYAAGACKGGLKEAKLHAAQKAYWFVKTHLKKIEKYKLTSKDRKWLKEARKNLEVKPLTKKQRESNEQASELFLKIFSTKGKKKNVLYEGTSVRSK